MAAGIVYAMVMIVGRIIDNVKLSNIKKRLKQIPNGKLKQKFLENKYRNFESKMTKRDSDIKKVQGITALPISLKEWGVYARFEYKRAYSDRRVKDVQFKKGDVDVQVIDTISERKLKNDKDCQKFIKDSKNPKP